MAQIPKRTKSKSKRADQGIGLKGLRNLFPSKSSSIDLEKGVAIRVSKSEKTLTTIQNPQYLKDVTNTGYLNLSGGSEFPDLKADLKKESGAKSTERNRLGFILIAICALLILAAGLTSSLSGTSEMSGQTPGAVSAEALNRVEYHRQSLGTKLNRERIAVEIENFETAPTQVGNLGAPSQQKDKATGLPMAPEAHHRSSSRDRLEALNPNFADSRVMYGLQEEQAAESWANDAQQQYIDEFVANAERAGVKVRVRKNGVVEVLRSPTGQTSGRSEPLR